MINYVFCHLFMFYVFVVVRLLFSCCFFSLFCHVFYTIYEKKTE